MFHSWRSKLREAERALAAGDLRRAASEVRSGGLVQFRPGRKLAERVQLALIEHGEQRAACGDFAQAWGDFSAAASIDLAERRDALARRTHRLVDLTVEHADELLRAGKPVLARQTAELVSSRRILDRRIDQIRKACSTITRSDQLAAAGRIAEARTGLAETLTQRPDLDYLQARMESFDHQQSELKSLSSQLRDALTGSHWTAARQLSQRMLGIAPHYQLAIDTLRRCDDVVQRRAAVNPAVESTVSAAESPTIVFPAEQRPSPQATLSGDGNGAAGLAEFSESEYRTLDDEPRLEIAGKMLWIDGVGGFLVCVGDRATVGQALGDRRVAIPISGDLRRQHARIERHDEAYVIEPLAETWLDDQRLAGPAVLADGNILTLGGGVRLRFGLAHPLSRTARLDYASRHRTLPWSDGVLLMADALVLADTRQAHVRCPGWSQPLVFHRRGEHWTCRYSGAFEVDGQAAEGLATLPPTCRISGEDFAVTLEAIGR